MSGVQAIHSWDTAFLVVSRGTSIPGVGGYAVGDAPGQAAELTASDAGTDKIADSSLEIFSVTGLVQG